MNTLERRMTDTLRRMHESYNLQGIKGEFEAEGAGFDELMRLREITGAAGIPMIVKVGGCEAITDIRAARTIGADAIVAPMVESSFAAQKFLKAVKLVYREDELASTSFLINVETKNGIRNFDEICALPEAGDLAGLDIGRMDMAFSMGLGASGCNHPDVLDACRSVCAKWLDLYPQKSCTVGGPLSNETILFLEALSTTVRVGCESKKAVFYPGVVSGGTLRDAFLLAIEFEEMWYQNCMENYDWRRTKNWSYFEDLTTFKAAL